MADDHTLEDRSFPSYDPEPDPPTRAFLVNICDDCFYLRGEMCNTPDCIFCWHTMDEVGEALNLLLIRPVVDGERLTASEGETLESLLQRALSIASPLTIRAWLDQAHGEAQPADIRQGPES